MFNETMSVVRVSLEWPFADNINCFKLLDFKNDVTPCKPL